MPDHLRYNMEYRIIEHRSLCIEPEYIFDYSDYERRIRIIEEQGKEIELRYNHNHDEKGRFCSGSGGAAVKKVDNSAESGIIKLEDIEIGKSLGAKAKNYDILDPSTGEYFKFAEGTKIQNAEVFAGKGCKKPLEKKVSEGLSKQIGGKPENWQHAKGHGIIDYYGEERPAEVHWFQEKSVGKHKFKIKRWED